ncbi:unnamed protein product [Durusdinium trenchii]|uniref:Pentatricopeptide repeat-containing protein n=1 Tax=Durusdinium trenchii TaxID=1381693 RepID=A0ABP0K3B2_9DINO
MMVVIHLSSVLSSLAQQWPRAMELLRCMEEDGMLLDTVCFNAALSACASCGQFEAALQLLEQMDASQVPKSYATASAAIVACGRRWPWALHFLASMPRNTFSYSAAISACEKSGELERDAAVVGGHAAWSVRLLERVPWNVVTCSACIAACEKGREWRRALQMLRQMRAAEAVRRKSGAASLVRGAHAGKVEPNTFSYNSAISACERGSQLTNALELLQATRPQPTTQGVRRRFREQDVVTYGSAIFACEHGGQWHTALKLLEEHGLVHGWGRGAPVVPPNRDECVRHGRTLRVWKTTVRRVVPCVVEIGGGDGRPAHREELRDLQRGLERLRGSSLENRGKLAYRVSMSELLRPKTPQKLEIVGALGNFDQKDHVCVEGIFIPKVGLALGGRAS